MLNLIENFKRSILHLNRSLHHWFTELTHLLNSISQFLWSEKKHCSHWGSNPGPLACEASVITTTLWKPADENSFQVYTNSYLKLLSCNGMKDQVNHFTLRYHCPVSKLPAVTILFSGTSPPLTFHAFWSAIMIIWFTKK